MLELFTAAHRGRSGHLFVDTVVSPQLVAGSWKYKYRVAARNNSYQTGLTPIEYIQIDAVFLGVLSAHITQNDTFVTYNPTICLSAIFNSPRSPIKTITWVQRFFVDSLPGSILDTKTLIEPEKEVIDTVCVTNKQLTGQTPSRVICTVQDSIGSTASDTALLMFIDTVNTVAPTRTGLNNPLHGTALSLPPRHVFSKEYLGNPE